MKMRRSERQITDPAEIGGIISRCRVCRLAMVDGDEPYVIPMNFGYREGTVYLHGAGEGRRTEILKTHPRVCVEFDNPLEFITHETDACRWSQQFESVLGWGEAEILTDPAEKREGLDAIMGQYSPKKGWEYEDKMVERTGVIRIKLNKITAKRFD